jgi:hypothetical protein
VPPLTYEPSFRPSWRHPKHLARYYLTHSAMTTGKIAYLLTYDDTKST